MIRRDLEIEDWGSVPFTLLTPDELSPDQKDDLVALVGAWYDDGTRNAFGGELHCLDPVGFDRMPDGAWTAEWLVDMGTAEQNAIDDLADRLAKFTEKHRLRGADFVVGVIEIA